MRRSIKFGLSGARFDRVGNVLGRVIYGANAQPPAKGGAGHWGKGHSGLVVAGRVLHPSNHGRAAHRALAEKIGAAAAAPLGLAAPGKILKDGYFTSTALGLGALASGIWGASTAACRAIGLGGIGKAALRHTPANGAFVAGLGIKPASHGRRAESGYAHAMGQGARAAGANSQAPRNSDIAVTVNLGGIAVHSAAGQPVEEVARTVMARIADEISAGMRAVMAEVSMG